MKKKKNTRRPLKIGVLLGTVTRLTGCDLAASWFRLASTRGVR